MIWHYLKSTFRSLYKNKVFVLINILGLGTSLACCIVAFLNWNYNVNFDTHHSKADQIYRINFKRLTGNRLVNNGSCPLPLGEVIKSSLSSLNDLTRVYPTGGNFKFDNELFRTSVAGVDPSFFNMFDFDFLSGSAEVIRDKRTIIISREIKEKYFRDSQNPVGETMTYIDGDQRVDFQIGGIFENPPQNSSFFSNEAYIHYDNILELYDWDPGDWSLFNSTFVQLNDPRKVSEVESGLQDFVAIQNEAKKDYRVHTYYLDPFAGMAVRAEREGLRNHWFNNSLPVSAAIAPGIMALLILLISCFNFTNTSIAISNQRIKEIGVRKVHGAHKRQLVIQFLGENLIICFIALLFGILLAAFLVPKYSAMWIFLDIQLNLFRDTKLLLFIAGLLLFTALVAGSYPAFYVSSFQPTTIFRGKVKFSGSNPLTRILLALQFTISLIALVCGFVFLKNAEYQAEYDLGFDAETVVFAYVKNESGYQTMRNKILENSSIKEIGGSRHSVTASYYNDPVKIGVAEHDVDIMDIGTNYLNAISATFLDGRDFIENSQRDVEKSVIINEEFVRTFGLEDPVGQRLVLRDTIELFVVGVIKDMLLNSVWNPVQPMMLRYVLPERYRYITIKTDLRQARAVKESMDNRWKEVFPEELSAVEYMKDRNTEAIEVNVNIRDLFLFLGIIAVLLSAIGQFSLVSLNLKKRQKEIGIRKVLGASTMNIANKVSKEFLIILFIAAILGSLAGAYLSNMLMSSIWSYHVSITSGIIVVSISILFFISIATVGYKIFRAATEVPAIFLQEE